ncbi:MAG: ABC transporter ATP-binding protein [Myxococcota bacterium]
MAVPLLRIDDLHVEFATSAGTVRAVDGVSLEVGEGETLALVGESGCGKSVTALSVLGLVPSPPSRVTAGRILFAPEGDAGVVDLVRAGDEELRAIRGNDVAMIFQEPMTSLNPVFRVGDQIAEAIVQHRGLDEADAFAAAVGMLARVGIPAPERRALDYPHQLSGGMCQRVMIAMALACDPKLLIADEPTTALDVTVQAQILDLLRALQSDLGTAILLITHDLGVVAEVAHRVVVMYAGRIVERASVADLFARPRHPYTAGLLRSIPRLGEEGARLEPVEGSVPDALALPAGCRFHPRCAFARERCTREAPPERRRNDASAAVAHASACFAVDEEPGLDLLAHDAPRASATPEATA